MSSLMQFNGRTSKQGVELPFYRTIPTVLMMHSIGEWVWHTDSDTWEYEVYDFQPLMSPESACDSAEDVACSICGKYHARIYTAWRKPKGMLGCWVVFEYNGEKHVPDLSIPIGTFRLPRDARPLDDEANAKYWHN